MPSTVSRFVLLLLAGVLAPRRAQAVSADQHDAGTSGATPSSGRAKGAWTVIAPFRGRELAADNQSVYFNEYDVDEHRRSGTETFSGTAVRRFVVATERVETLLSGMSCAPEQLHLTESGLVWYCRGPVVKDHPTPSQLMRQAEPPLGWPVDSAYVGVVADEQTVFHEGRGREPPGTPQLFATEAKTGKRAPLPTTLAPLPSLLGVCRTAVIGLSGQRAVIAIDKKTGADRLLWSSATPSVGAWAVGREHVVIVQRSVAANGYSPRFVLISIPLSGPARELLAVEYPESIARDLSAAVAVEGDAVYFVRSRHTPGRPDVSSIERIGLGGGRPEVVVANPGPKPHQLTVGGDRLYWISGASLRATQLR